MTFNCWYDLTQVRDGLDKAVSAIQQSKADLIGLQESSPATAEKLAERLGFHRVTSGDATCQIISRFPIVEGIPVSGMDVKRAVAAKILIPGEKGREIIFYKSIWMRVHTGPMPRTSRAPHQNPSLPKKRSLHALAKSQDC